MVRKAEAYSNRTEDMRVLPTCDTCGNRYFRNEYVAPMCLGAVPYCRKGRDVRLFPQECKDYVMNRRTKIVEAIRKVVNF